MDSGQALATMDSGQPWVPHGDKTSQPRSEQWLMSCMATAGTHVSPGSLLKLHGLTGAGFFTATGATGCGICRGWVTTFGWFHHLGNKWMALFFAQDPGHFASEGFRVSNQCLRFS